MAEAPAKRHPLTAADPAAPAEIQTLHAQELRTVVPRPRPEAGLVFERVGGSEVVQVTGAEDVRLKCGKAEIILCADGRIILRGTELILESQGQLKLNGAYVNIN